MTEDEKAEKRMFGLVCCCEKQWFEVRDVMLGDVKASELSVRVGKNGKKGRLSRIWILKEREG